ncbi:peptidase M14 [Pyrenophora tritici-repentis]|uniref:Peptidase M14 n=2 Tax=Pyrenophora tritici-repentis TaxID=45151 RepID=A0A2W1DUZ7_9PLEO|nr:peptidase M14 [Pyrenophora tritici-repentis Pt-1C-BFP]KAA8626213.1 Peptidase M14 [Pyrenophora tritici-repentis]EDU40989.1 peptidase M14 [Pyrenophora tritici-repentis Pt-1C-BFP]KAF7454625.1 Peptidase M14 [Pyrenophora tritici-repentis]KAF7577750.1 peptidase M14 [Pyrenophora tritici-repentis]KAG9388381.1 Peptidase M14 [Pyrenophora tritici-repentis]
MKYAIVAALILQSTTVLGSLLPVYFKAPSPAHFLDVVNNGTYDLGCRPKAVPTEQGHFELHAYLTEEQIAHLTKEYENSSDISLHRRDLSKRQGGNAPIGSGDRWQGGAIAPSGLGTKAAGSTISSIMNVNEINSAIKGLASAYSMPTITLPYKTFNGATQTAAYVGAGTDKSAYRLYLSAGMHARERGGPDQLIYWISDLLAANKAGTGLKYGSKSYTNAQVKTVLAAGIVFFPLVNPDGVAYDQSTGSLWRKNRNTRSGSSGSSVGVDINRNFDFLWNFRKYFDPSTSPASTSPSSEAFYGSAAASESETKNHVSVYDSFPNIRWFMDIHSATGDILYNWGDDETQSTSTTMNFLNTAYDGKRGRLGDSTYKEYMPSTDVTNIKNIAAKTATAMRAVGGRSYSSMQSVGLYATSGASDDYAASRVYAKSGAKKVNGFTMEFGYATNFYPTLSEFNSNILDTNAGFMDWALAAIAAGYN